MHKVNWIVRLFAPVAFAALAACFSGCMTSTTTINIQGNNTGAITAGGQSKPITSSAKMDGSSAKAIGGAVGAAGGAAAGGPVGAAAGAVAGSTVGGLLE